MIIRPLTVFERDAIKKLYLSLSEDDRRMRFCASASDDTVCRYVAGLNFARTTIIGAFDESAQLVGLAELARGEQESEMAFAVRAELRGQKIGTRLMERLLVAARMSGVRKVTVMFLSENTPMRRLAGRAGMRARMEGMETTAALELQAPGAEDLTRWLVEEGFAHGGYFGTLMIARWGSLLNQSMNVVPLPVSMPRSAATGPGEPSTVRDIRTGSNG